MAALIALSGGLAACSGAPRVVVGPKAVDVCFRAVPAARSAVRGRGHLVTVAHTDVAAVRRAVAVVARRVPPPAALAGAHGHVCLVVWRGRFANGSVASPWAVAPPPTRFAVVVVADPSAKTLATILVEARPVRLARFFSLTD